jgi:hypothetical protein
LFWLRASRYLGASRSRSKGDTRKRSACRRYRRPSRPIDQQAQGRSIGEIEKQTAKGTTHYAVALGSGNQKQELVIDEGGKVIATNAGEDDDD